MLFIYLSFLEFSPRFSGSPLEREVIVAGGRRFQDEAARYENTRRESDRRRAGSSNSPAAVARVTRCDMTHRSGNWIESGRPGAPAHQSARVRRQCSHCEQQDRAHWASTATPGPAWCDVMSYASSRDYSGSKISFFYAKQVTFSGLASDWETVEDVLENMGLD